MKALFLDRDGTLIIDRHYLHDPAGVELFSGVAEALGRAKKLGYRLYLHTNQSGIGRGYYTLADAVRCNERMEQLAGLGPEPLFAGICIAPEAPGQSSLYRKPSPRYILEMIARDNLDPAQCWMVGDREADIDAGLNAKIHTAALCTGKRTRADWAAIPACRDVPVFDDFPAFVKTLAQCSSG
jgi:D-glycero-D-manno-heptose 1,7-bisphosphate phosphatase